MSTPTTDYPDIVGRLGGGYQTIGHGLAFRPLAAAGLARFVEPSKTSGQTAALEAFREEARARRRPR